MLLRTGALRKKWGKYAPIMSLNLAAVRSAFAGGGLVLDGGSATTLESAGHDLSSGLWSAALLRDDPQAIVAMHLDFLRAGADVIETTTYQASRMGFTAAGMTTSDADELLRVGCRLARTAVEQYMAEPGFDESRYSFGKPLIAASIGPYGAALADGSEYRGNYGVAAADLRQFHLERIEVLADCDVDLFAFETVPDLDEARVIVELMGTAQYAQIPYWLSFTADSNKRLAGSALFADAVQLAATGANCVAIGLNCTKPEFITPLLRNAQDIAPQLARVVYPNAGRVWDAVARDWLDEGIAILPTASVQEWREAGAVMVGGCCGLGPAATTAMRAL